MEPGDTSSWHPLPPALSPDTRRGAQALLPDNGAFVLLLTQGFLLGPVTHLWGTTKGETQPAAGDRAALHRIG